MPERFNGHTAAQEVRGAATLPFGAFYGREDIRVTCPGIDLAIRDADPHRIVERHSHEEAHFVFVTHGLYVSSARGAAAVSDGPVLIFNPAGTTHRDRFEARTARVSGRFLTLSLTAAALGDAHGDAPRPEFAHAMSDAAALQTAHRLVGACERQRTALSLEHESLALDLVTMLPPHARAGGSGVPAWVVRAREHLDDCAGESVRLAAVAADVGVHPVHLARVFRRAFGVTPGDYVRGRRLARACALIRHTSQTLSDIALQCGFVDQSHLTRAFTRAMGATPAAFRRSLATAATPIPSAAADPGT